MYYWNGSTWIAYSSTAAALGVTSSTSIALSFSANKVSASALYSASAADSNNIKISLDTQSDGIRAQLPVSGSGSIRAQFSATAPITYSSTTGDIGSTAAASGVAGHVTTSQQNMSGTKSFIDGIRVGASGSLSSASYLYEAVSTTKAAYPFPSMTTTQRNAIASPVAGMAIYNSTLGCPEMYMNSIWQPMDGSWANTGQQNVADAGAISMTNIQYRRLTIPVASSNSSPAMISATAGIAAGNYHGQEMMLIGDLGANAALTIQSGTTVSINGTCTLDEGETMHLIWNGVDNLWLEVARSEG